MGACPQHRSDLCDRSCAVRHRGTNGSGIHLEAGADDRLANRHVRYKSCRRDVVGEVGRDERGQIWVHCSVRRCEMEHSVQFAVDESRRAIAFALDGFGKARIAAQ